MPLKALKQEECDHICILKRSPAYTRIVDWRREIMEAEGPAAQVRAKEG